MAIAGPNYECLHADAGTNGRVNNGGVWYKCGFSKALENQEHSIPIPRCLPRGVQRIPFVLIADDAFVLKTHMMKPYSQQNVTTEERVYNYRHSRASRISENLLDQVGLTYWQIDGVFIIRSCYLSQQLLKVLF